MCIINAASVFAGIGVDEYYLAEEGINICVANELSQTRANAYKQIYPSVEMLVGDITDPDVQLQFIELCKENNVKMLIATPPCQGLSMAGFNKTEASLREDRRNYLILSVLEVFDQLACDYMVIENVPRFMKMVFPFGDRVLPLADLLGEKYSDFYNVDCQVFNAADYGVPQTRLRVVYRLWKKGLEWELPKKEQVITVADAIGDLPSLEAGEVSTIPNHTARPHPINQIECMRHTPTGKSAFDNDYYYPRKADGSKIKGFKNTYKRMRWDMPAPTITMRNEIISSQENVHPGRPLGNGLWSDARVLTLREVLILSSLPADMRKPESLSETSFRQLIGEGIPPLLFKKILAGANKRTAEPDIRVLSMFSGGGIAETYFKDIGVNVKVANELLPERAEFYTYCYPETEMICGDITDNTIYQKVIAAAKEANINMILATPPCQGMSTLGRKDYDGDERNGLIKYVVAAIEDLQPDYILIENVPKFGKLKFYDQGEYVGIVTLLTHRFSDDYTIDVAELNAMDYGVPQSRPRIIIKLYKKGLVWGWPNKERKITLREAIGHLPSLESGQISGIKWHNALKHNERQIEAMRHTPEGKSAMANEYYYPRKADGTKVSGFHNTYKRMKWDEPAPARATNSHLISGHNNVHPGRPLGDGLWSDARVLTLRELVIVSSLPEDWDIPADIKEPIVREIIGEAIPPLLSKRIVEMIGKE